MSDRICESLGCAMYDLAKNSLYYTTYAAGYVGGSIPSGIAKGVEGLATGTHKVSQLFAHTVYERCENTGTGVRHGLLYHDLTQAAGVALAGLGISYAGYALYSKQKLFRNWIWSHASGSHHIQIPPLSAFLRAAAGATMMIGGALMPICTFYHGTWGVAPVTK